MGFTVNGQSFSVDVAAGDSLSAIADKINSADDNVGVIATIVTTDGGSRLVISSDTEGTDNNISVTATDTTGTGLSDMFGAGNLSEVQAAKESIVYIDGQKLQSQTNEIKNAIAGVTLNLTDADLNKTSVLKIELDEDAVKENVQGFVDAYNSLMSTIDKVSSYDADKEKASALQGDSMIRSIESQMRNMISNRIDLGGGQSVALYDIGIESDRYGKLSVDSTKLDKAISEDMSSIEGLFATDTTGLANRLDTLVNGYVKSGGLIDSRNNAYTTDKKRLDKQREAFSLKMEQLEKRLFKQFNAMDLVVGKLNQQSTDIVNGLKSLSGVISQKG